MAESSQMPNVTKASWDENNTGIFLQLLVDEIDAGNRPSGQFTRQAWSTITNRFQELSGCKFTQPQLKNKWDNLKKDFSLWEKLLHDETRLGYDYVTGRVTADPSWWRQKIQERPEYRRFKTHGPIHLELQERVFRGHVATGYMEYIPGGNTDFPFNQTEPEQQMNDNLNNDQQNLDNDTGTLEENTQTNGTMPPNRVASRGGSTAKRKRSRSSCKNPSGGDVNANMMELINKWHQQEESSASVKANIASTTSSYEDALALLESLPWMDDNSSEYAEAMLILEDPIKRIALKHIKDKPEEFVRNWIRLHHDFRLHRNMSSQF